MSRRSVAYTIACLVLVALLPTLLHPRPARGAEDAREFTFATKTLYVGNVVGAVDIQPAAGEAFRVTVQLRGEDASRGLVELQQEGSALRIVFPLAQHTTYVYPELGSGRSVSTDIRAENPEEKSWLRRTFGVFKGRRLTVRGSGNGLEVWADVRIEVPAGSALTLRHGVGDITASGVQADLDLDSNYGLVGVEDVRGELRADTGSGAVTVRRVEGDLDLDTGSGDVEVRDSRAGRAHIDTGSGRVGVAGLDCRTLAIDTGSGDVEVVSTSADEADIDTGSGEVRLELDRMGNGRFKVDTGSGGVELRLPAGASASILADTGSGDIDSDVPGASFEKIEGGQRRLVVGDGAADVLLDTGSGSVFVSSR